MIARLSIEPTNASASSWPVRRPPSPAMAAAHDAIKAQAARTIPAMIKERAGAYLAMPWQRDQIRRGFIASAMTPEQLIEFGKEVLRQETTARARFELVPVKKINAKAAVIAGRYLRAKAHQISRRAA